MGVNGLWTVLHPCARPIKLETLNKKRLAVDASIWIYQFLKAVRDKEGNALRNSHVVGFFRRICKLLFFGIKPVFVFDGGAPALKRQTIAARKRRREGRREDAVRTAGKLLAMQVQRRAEEENEERRRRERDKHHNVVEEEAIPDDAVYVDELLMTQQERRQPRQFKKKDQYHLPDLEGSLETMGAPDDPRIMSHEELEAYARQFHSGEDINLYDFSKIDFDSPFFLSLPASDRYNILNAARLRSRLRMGYSKDQLDTMFPDRMAFSKFQIDRVTERNDLTQRLMNINGINGDDTMDGVNGAARIAGEKGREYVLVKNDAVEGGWALGVVSGNTEGERNRPIDVDRSAKSTKVDDKDEDWEDEDGGFEDVPIEGLNRLPKITQARGSLKDDVARRRRALYEARKKSAGTAPLSDEEDAAESNSLFVEADDNGIHGKVHDQAVEALFEDNRFNSDDEEDDLNRAIAMSLESNFPNQSHRSRSSQPNNATSGHMQVDDEAHLSGPARTGGAGTSFLPDDDSDDDMDLQAALARSRLTAVETRRPDLGTNEGQQADKLPPSAPEAESTNKPRHDLFGGPLPFEKLASIPAQPDDGGGFEKETAKQTPEKPLPLPPWFSGDIQQDLEAQRALEQRQVDDRNLSKGSHDYEPPILKKQVTKEVIDLESDDEKQAEMPRTDEVVASTAMEGDVEMADSAAQDAAAAIELEDSPVPDGSAMDTAGEATPILNEDPDSVVDGSVEKLAGAADMAPQLRTPSPEFEDVMPPDDVPSKEPMQEQTPTSESGLASPPPREEAADMAIKDEEANEYSDPEDDQLFQQLAAEAEEHARFASSLNHKSTTQNQEDYERELRALRNQQKKDRRDADEVTNVMITECQQLLTLFGLPYITAPMEAEAQCAELVKLGLVDGIVTDDSDCFLFGGTRIYKNMFNQAKYVECYLSHDLEKEFDLDRNKLIRFAHLLGSDYTEGIPGIGPVTALEILSEFGSDDGLEEFKEWWQGVQKGIQFPEDAKSPFRKKFRRNVARIFLPPTFPSVPVTEAYLRPEVDDSRDPFQWGVPDLEAIRAFLMSTIGWSKERTDEVLVPVIRDMNRREHEGTQSNLTAFFGGGTGAGAFAPRRVPEALSRAAGRKTASRRMEGALGKLKEGAKRKRRSTGNREEDEEQEQEQEQEEQGEDQALDDDGIGGHSGGGDDDDPAGNGVVPAPTSSSSTKKARARKTGPKRKRKATATVRASASTDQ